MAKEETRAEAQPTPVIGALAWTFAMFLIGLANPLGFERAADAHSQRLVEQLTAPFYRTLDRTLPWTTSVDTNGQDEISVFMITEASLGVIKDKEGPNWPISFDAHRKIITSIMIRRPEALFLDYLVLDDLGTEEKFDGFKREIGRFTKLKDPQNRHNQFLKIHEVLKEGGIPIIIAADYTRLNSLDTDQLERRDTQKLLDEVAIFSSPESARSGYELNPRDDFPSPALLLYYIRQMNACIRDYDETPQEDQVTACADKSTQTNIRNLQDNQG